jgi:hypothetical protein
VLAALANARPIDAKPNMSLLTTLFAPELGLTNFISLYVRAARGFRTKVRKSFLGIFGTEFFADVAETYQMDWPIQTRTAVLIISIA